MPDAHEDVGKPLRIGGCLLLESVVVLHGSPFAGKSAEVELDPAEVVLLMDENAVFGSEVAVSDLVMLG